MDDTGIPVSPDNIDPLTEREKRPEQAKITHEEWKQLCAVFSNGCALCGDSRGLIPDLVVPHRLGGGSGIENVQPLCAQCCTLKRGYLVDYRPFEPLDPGFRLATVLSHEAGGNIPTRSPQVPKMLTQKHVLAIEHQYSPPESNLVEDPIVEYDVAPLLIEELKRLRAIIVVNPALARIESLAWRERYSTLVPKTRAKKLAANA